jgi:hypothetical protein
MGKFTGNYRKFLENHLKSIYTNEKNSKNIFFLKGDGNPWNPEANRLPNWLPYGPTGPGNLLEVFLRSIFFWGKWRFFFAKLQFLKNNCQNIRLILKKTCNLGLKNVFPANFK